MDSATRMSDQPSSEETARLSALVPLHTLPDEALAELLETVSFESVGRGKMLFKEGDTDHEHVYLLEGTVVLLSKDVIVDTIQAGSGTARFPLAHQLPRKHSVRAKKKVRIARIDSRVLSDVLARSQTVDYQVADFEEATEDDWMSMLLQASVLQQVPAANIQQVMINVEQVEVEKDTDLIRQGDPGDFYYMLTRGRAVVRRDNGDGKGPCELATLGPGDAFGEEALLSDSPRNSSVTMLQDGLILRLSKEHFLELLHNPLLDRLDMQAAQAKVDQGAVWLDLRSSEKFDESHLPGAINFPLESLRYQASSLAQDEHYVLCSDADGRAMAGAFLLTERGIAVSVLEGGFGQDEEPQAPPETSATIEPEDSTRIEPAAPISADPGMQDRFHEAELRAKELEERLIQAQRDQESVTAERQQNLLQVRQAVDQARRKLLETEEQKREALAAKQQAYAEMAQLTGSLEAIETERASLLNRMSEIEGLDKQLQDRLAKAERELIGERERAESATSSLEELSERLAEILEKREQEREQHARERGELKEEMTELQMELEQAQLDLEELSQRLAAREATEAGDSEALKQAQQRLNDAQAEQQKLAAERDDLQARLVSASGELERLQAAQQQLSEVQQQLEAHEQQAMAARRELQAQLEQSTVDREGLQQQLADAEEQAAKTLAQAEERAAKIEQTLDETERASAESLNAMQAELDAALAEISAQQESAKRDLNAASSTAEELKGALDEALAQTETLKGELDQLRSDHTALQSQLASENEQAGAAIEQANARAAELETRLEEEKQQAKEMLAAKLAELEASESELKALQTRAAEDAGALEAVEAERTELQNALNGAREELGQKTEALQAELEKAHAETASMQETAERELTAAQAAAEAAREELQLALEESKNTGQRVVEGLQGELAQLRGEHDLLQSQIASGSQEAGAAIEQAQARVAELESLLDEAKQQAGESLAAGLAELEAAGSELEALRTKNAEDVAALEAANAEAAELRAGLGAAQQKLEETNGQLQGELEHLRNDRESLQSQLAAAKEEAGSSLEQAQARAAELEDKLNAEREKADQSQAEFQAADAALAQAQVQLSESEGGRQKAAGQLDAKQAELNALQDEFQVLQAKTAEDAAALETAALGRVELQTTLDRVQAELEQLRADNDALQVQLTSGDKEAGAAIEQAQTRVTELERRLDEEARQAGERLEAVQSELAQANAELDSVRAKGQKEFAQADETARMAAEKHEAEIERLTEANALMQEKLDREDSDSEEALGQLRAEILEMSQRLEERELAVNAARAEQQELIEALNAASAELETLQLAVSDKDDEQARLVDLENQVAEALRTHENELLAHEQEQRQLREQLAEETDRRHTLQKEIDRLTALAEQGPSDAAGGDGELLSERDKLLAELAVRESEVDQLRNVIAEYVDQIRAAQSDDATGSDVAALRAELEMVREQAIRDVAQMREKLAAAETQQRRLQQADGREAISHEAMRQRIEGLESSLAERQRELGGAEKSRHELEDSLEDANRQLDELRRELDRARGEADDAVSSRREAESARKQLKEEICRLQEDMEEAKITDLRDARLKATPSKRPIGIDSVAAPRRWLTGFLGAGVLLALLEALSIYSGRGELFTALLRLSGQ